MYPEIFEKLYKTISEFISCKVSDFFYSESTQREDGHSKGTPRALAHSGTQGIWGLRQSNTWSTQSLKGHLRYLGNKIPVHLGARRALGHSGTQASGHLGNRGTRDTFLANSFSIFFSLIFCTKIAKTFLDYYIFSGSTKIKWVKFADHSYDMPVRLRKIPNVYDTPIAWDWKLKWEGLTWKVILTNSKLFSKTQYIYLHHFQL